jgi:hypothetical protein
MGSLRDLNRRRNEPTEDKPAEDDLGGFPMPFSSKWFLEELDKRAGELIEIVYREEDRQVSPEEANALKEEFLK